MRSLGAAPLFWLVACSSQPLSTSEHDGATELGGTPLSVSVPSSGEALVDLAAPAVIPSAGDTRPAFGWDLGFRGFDVFTNGGVSSDGAGAAFGLLSLPTFLSDTAPAVPFLTADQPGGAFRHWYAYDPDNHVLLSRYHVYGVRSGERLFKLQVLSYYGGRSGDTSASYSLRYAEVSEGTTPLTHELTSIDASAGGDASDPLAPSTCIELGAGVVLSLTPAEAHARSDWQLCFRRDAISVNGGEGGPGGVTALDLDAAHSESELVSELRTLTPQSESARFDAVGLPELSDASANFRSDQLVTAFTDRWLAPDVSPPEPAAGVWLVVGADGQSHYLLMFEGFKGATQAGPGTVALRVKAVL